MEPRRTRNRTGIKMVKTRAIRSRTKPRNIARDRLRKACVFTGHPASCGWSGWRSCPVLPPGQVQEHVFHAAALRPQARQRPPVGQRGEDDRWLAGDKSQGRAVVSDHGPVSPRGKRAGLLQADLAGFNADPDRLIQLTDQGRGWADLEDLAVVHDGHSLAE